MAIAKQKIHPQNHFIGKPNLFTFKKYKTIIIKTAVNNDDTKKVAPLKLLHEATIA